MAVPVSFDHGAQNPRHDNGPWKPLINHGRYLGGIVTQGSRAELGEANLLECDVGEIKHLSSARLVLSIHPLLEIFIGRGRDALFGLGQEIHAFAEDNRPGGAYPGASRLLVLLQALLEAELAFDDLRIPVVPLELWHVEWASHLAVTAPDAERTIPGHSSPFIFLQGTKGTASDAG